MIKGRYLDADIKIQSKIEKDIENFKQKIFNDYKIKLYIGIPKIKNQLPIISLQDFWNMICLEIIEKRNPELLQYTNFKKRTRTREWMIYIHSFTFLCNRYLHFGPTEIAKFLHKTHASAINSINKTSNAMWAKDRYFLSVHNKLHKKLKEYVGTISENTKI